jgi:hypothetical protein
MPQGSNQSFNNSREYHNYKRKLELRKNIKSKKLNDSYLNIKRPRKFLTIYRKWKLEQKLAFAERNFTFGNNTGEPAIRLCESKIKMKEGMSRGIEAGKALPYLPKGLVVPFMWHNISKKLATGKQSYYQVQLADQKFLFLNTNVKANQPNGYGNLINAAIDYDEMSSRDYQAAVSDVTDQHMGINQCDIALTKRRELKEVYPAYIKVIKNIPIGH